MKYVSASAFAVSVFPTPVGPRNKKLPIGPFLVWTPVLALLRADEISLMASSCPTTLFCKIASKSKRISFSWLLIFPIGICVFSETRVWISSGVTTLLSLSSAVSSNIFIAF